MNKFLKLSEEQLVKILQRGQLDHQDFLALKEAMERKGLKGMIMCVGNDNTNDVLPMKAVHEYLEYHKKIKPAVKKKEINTLGKALLNKKTKIEDKKAALVNLAHVATPEVFAVLKTYHGQPDKELKVWSELALQECQFFLKSELFNEGEIHIGSLSGTKGDKMRFYFMFKTLDGETVDEEAADFLEKVLLEGADYFGGEMEKLEFGKTFAIISILLPFDVAPADFAQAAINIGNRNGFLWHGDYYVNNTHHPKTKDIRNFFEINH